MVTLRNENKSSPVVIFANGTTRFGAAQWGRTSAPSDGHRRQHDFRTSAHTSACVRPMSLRFRHPRELHAFACAGVERSPAYQVLRASTKRLLAYIEQEIARANGCARFSMTCAGRPRQGLATVAFETIEFEYRMSYPYVTNSPRCINGLQNVLRRCCAHCSRW